MLYLASMRSFLHNNLRSILLPKQKGPDRLERSVRPLLLFCFFVSLLIFRLPSFDDAVDLPVHRHIQAVLVRLLKHGARKQFHL